MKHPYRSLIRSASRRAVLVALGSALILAVVPAPGARAAQAAPVQPLADKAPALPLTPTFKKVADAEDGPFVLSLENTSKDSIKVTATIYPSVVFHANAKVHTLPAHVIDAGQSWSIPGLASTDKVTLAAEGYSSLEITVP